MNVSALRTVGSFRNHVGNMSKEHDFVGAFDMVLIIAASVTSSNYASWQAAVCIGVEGELGVN